MLTVRVRWHDEVSLVGSAAVQHFTHKHLDILQRMCSFTTSDADAHAHRFEIHQGVNVFNISVAAGAPHDEIEARI